MIRLQSTETPAPHPGMTRFETWCFGCLRCGHHWLPREAVTPKVCPLCKSPYWDRPRRDGTPSARLSGVAL